MANPTDEQVAYARWVLDTGYVPFSKDVDGCGGMLHHAATHRVSRDPDDKAGKAALLEYERAQAVSAGKSPKLPRGWPGKRPLTIMTARSSG